MFAGIHLVEETFKKLGCNICPIFIARNRLFGKGLQTSNYLIRIMDLGNEQTHAHIFGKTF